MSWIERGPYFKSNNWMIFCRCGWDIWTKGFRSILLSPSRHVYFVHKSEWVPFSLQSLEDDRETFDFLSEVARYIE